MVAAPAQVEIGPGVLGHELWLRVKPLIEQLIWAVTPKDAAHECDLSGSLLSDKMAERERKKLGAEELLVLLMFDTTIADEVLRVIARARRWDLERIRTRSPEEELRDTRAWIQSHASALLPSLNKAMGREPPEGSQR